MLNAAINRLRKILHGPSRAVFRIDSLLIGDQLEEAVILVEESIGKFGRRPELIVSYAKVHARLGNNSEVVASLRAIPVTSLTATSVLFDSASLMTLAGEADSADRIFQYLMREREHWHSALRIAQRHFQMQSYDSAVEAFATVFGQGGTASWEQVIQSLQGCSNEVAHSSAEQLAAINFSSPVKQHFYKMLSLLDARRGRPESSMENIRRATETDFALRDSPIRFNRKLSPLKPGYLIIGAMKCGTTTLNDLITQHPLCIEPMEKEMQFFQFPHLCDEWYLEHFPRVDTARGVFTGDASPGYYLFDIQNRIKTLLPDVKILFIERDPAERAISHIRHNNRQGISAHDVDAALTGIDELEQCISEGPQDAERIVTGMTFNKQHNSYLLLGLYELHLRRWKRVFGPQQILTLGLEHLRASPQIVVKQVFDFLEVPAAKVKLRHINKGSYSLTDPKTGQVVERLRRFYDAIKKLTSTFPDDPFTSSNRTDFESD